MIKLKHEVSKAAIAAEMRKEAEIMYANTYDKERLLQTYMNAVHNTFKKLRADKEPK